MVVFKPIFKVYAGFKSSFVIQTVVKCPLADLTIMVKLRGREDSSIGIKVVS